VVNEKRKLKKENVNERRYYYGTGTFYKKKQK
jgi:hypothetical protein